MANLKELRYPIFTPETSPFHPIVTLISASQTTLPHDQFTPEQLVDVNSLKVVSSAAAQTCYSDRLHTPLDYLIQGPDYQQSADRIATSVDRAGHHSTIEHVVYQFGIVGISRLASAVLNDIVFYVTDQQSQRYVEMKPSSTIPIDFGTPEYNQLGTNLTERLFQAYNSLNQILRPTIQSAYQQRYGKIDERAIDKLTQEISRYVLPQSVSTNVTYSINALTLIRLHYLQKTFGPELRTVINSMVETVCLQDPSVKRYLRQPFEPETNTQPQVTRQNLPLWYPNSPVCLDPNMDVTHQVHKIARAVRQYEVQTPQHLPDPQALDLVLNPRNNPHLTTVLNPGVIDPYTRTLNQGAIDFDLVLSLSADAQLQRHRSMYQTKPSQTPIPTQIDHFYAPDIIRQNSQALDLYLQAMTQASQVMTLLVDSGVPQTLVQYLAPNATLITKQVSAPLPGFLHFLNQRACYRAQIEIHEIAVSIAKRLQLEPILSQYLNHITPCAIRHQANLKPYCPENRNQWCGVANWDNTLDTLPKRRI